MKKNGFKVSDIGFIIYANGKSDEKEFGGNLMFDEHLYTLKCDTNWVDKILEEMYECLNSESLPRTGGGWNGQGCEQCAYKKSLAKLMRAQIEKENQVNSE